MWAARSRGLIRRMTGARSSASAAPRRPKPSDRALHAAKAASDEWDRVGGDARASLLDRAADLFEADRPHLMALMVREAGKTLAECPRRFPRGGRSSSLLCRRSAPEICCAARAQGTDRRAERALAARPRRVRGDLALELPTRHFHWPDRRSARRRQCRGGQAGRADAADRRPRGKAHASGRHSARRAAHRFRAMARSSARLWSAILASTASCSPAAPTPASPSIGRSLCAMARSSSSSPRPAGRTP